MREICTSGSMSGERKRDEGIMPALPRLSSTLLPSKCAQAPETFSPLIQEFLDECGYSDK